MKIKDIIKTNQPGTYSELNSKKGKELTEREIKELMGHSFYKRGHGGAIKQVR